MRKVTKEKSPEWFEKWKDEFRNAQGREPHYVSDFSTDDDEGKQRRYRLREQLVKEQGYICCYCMGRIFPKSESSHIEHFWPKKHFKDMDLDYENLFASCQGNYQSEDYCGHRKNDWWDVNMVMPTENRIEKMFYYTEDGRIHSAQGSDMDIAQKMIRNLGLDSYHLERNRKEAIDNSELYDDMEYTEEEIRDFIAFYDGKQGGKYTPYCKAIIDCLMRVI